ncbi:hypothetical protein BWQ96_02850 [Gracilariopsis chorda]|uniref:Metallo-beta-lactamase domain-containing protein n=1 Tax=Gracilariopsis chorda TaxID=448386 RepID=A0A2V3J1U3_9FLOR|nr:hypothetical protein BWQ96_02850 [Gracilariopsis chorda]|eukprot:PXF47370.1 hypothetical protein BWQ96_02850 [Gracilariopsis chorda]
MTSTPSPCPAFILPAAAPLRNKLHTHRHSCRPLRPRSRDPLLLALSPKPSPSPSQPQSPSPTPTPSPSPFSTDNNVLRYISLSNNSFALRHADKTILVDPWLYHDLIFFTPAFFRAKKPLAPDPQNDFRSFDASKVDAIVLTQALPDHAHVPTLRRLPKHIPVISTPAARSILRQLRFSNVTYTDYAQTVSPFPAVRITTLKGSLVGPPWSRPEHAYIFTFDTQNQSPPIQLYHEPHGNNDQRALRQYQGRIDVVVAPVKAARLAFGYALVNGVEQALQLCRCVLPRTVVPFDNGSGNVSGVLATLLRGEGGLHEFRTRLAEEQQLKGVHIVFPSAIGTEYVVASRNEDV